MLDPGLLLVAFKVKPQEHTRTGGCEKVVFRNDVLCGVLDKLFRLLDLHEYLNPQNGAGYGHVFQLTLTCQMDELAKVLPFIRRGPFDVLFFAVCWSSYHQRMACKFSSWLLVFA